jgi:hypothetical protein
MNINPLNLRKKSREMAIQAKNCWEILLDVHRRKPLISELPKELETF